MRSVTLATILTIIFLYSPPLPALAEANPDTGPGCGLGKQLWANYPRYKSIAPQVMMASTNVTGSYWFAIASGTSGCTNDGYMIADQKALAFIITDFENITQDLAQGHGEHLISLAALLGIHSDRHEHTFAQWQSRYRDWFGDVRPSPEALLLALSGSQPSVPASQ